MILSGDETSISSKTSIKSNPFLDIHNSFKHPFDLDLLRCEPIYECQFQHYISKLDRHETKNTDSDLLKVSYYSIFKEFDEETSRRLFDNCKRNGTTIQGVLCISRAIWLINEKLGLSNCLSEGKISEVEYLDNVIMDNRYYFGLSQDDVFNGAATISWILSLKFDGDLWKMASDISNDIKQFRADNSGDYIFIENF